MGVKYSYLVIPFVVPLLWALTACTQPAETTGVGAATGGVIGAGLGAVVGNQTGNAAGGLAVGALAGAATGAVIGNAFEAQEEAFRSQDEAIERQERLIRAQRSEIEELRGLSRDQLSFRAEPGGPRSAFDTPPVPSSRTAAAGRPPSAAADSFVPVRGRFDDTALGREQTPAAAEPGRGLIPLSKGVFGRPAERQMVEEPTVPPDSRASLTWTGEDSVEQVKLMPAPPATYSRVNLDTPECQRSEKEIEAANASAETADKLFHYRRALRLCPDNPSYHNGLGEIYRTLNRQEDAEFEFREALRLDPNYAVARQNLDSLSR